MFGRRPKVRDPEISPDEIFLDAANLPDFNQSSLEGRLEKPLGRGMYITFGTVVVLILIGLTAQAAHLELVNGKLYATRSQNNLLRPEVLFAQRGAILDRNGLPLVTNVTGADGFVKRVYKTPGFSTLLGYVSYPKKDSSGQYYDTDITGLAGIEKSFNTQLSGQNGTLLVEQNAYGKVVSEGSSIPPQDGQDLTLSIDVRAQTAFYDAIQQLADRIPFKGGSGILMNANTGEILALVSYPEYDSNVMSSGGPADVIAGYATNSRSPYLDRPIQGLYTPGSVVKPLEASGAVTDGFDPSTTINDVGYITVPNPYDPTHPTKFVDWESVGVEDLRKAIEFSSDVYFYMVGGGYGNQKGLGITRLAYWYQTFGLTSRTGIQLPNEAVGFVPTPDWKQKTFNEAWTLGDTYHTAIGQYDMQVTPIEEARAIAAIANGGKLVTPTLLKDQPVQGESIAVSPQALEVVREGMREGVAGGGTSTGLNDLSFVQPAGKTGTAQTGTTNQYFNAWAVGFWPYNDPKYVYVVMMDQGPTGDTYGGIYVMHQFFEELHAAAPEYFSSS
ncbi:MAG: penicillin-binding transpeptidase domain-containing protein [Candidatus Pacebacteria bacterium]|nr:penicillin-binding transpeptidase domain-containing protein [Candidatus Paceibacterota bacterium]